MKLNEENQKLAAEYGIPALRKRRNQKGYYVLHLRSATWCLQWLMVIDFLLLITLFYLFFTIKPETYYATSLNGKNTLLTASNKNSAQSISMQYSNTASS